MAVFAAVRLRGNVNKRREVKDTLRMLGLTRVNHCVLVPDTPSYRGMLQKVKDFITWGEVDCDTVELLLRHRGELVGGKKLTDENVKALGYPSLSELAKAICEGKIRVEGLKKVFRLHPPKKGLKSIKHPFGHGGDLGYRGKAINDLIARMV